MTNSPSNSEDRRHSLIRIMAGLLLFAGSYALLNQWLLVHMILYRAAAFDYSSAIWAFAAFAVQALVLLAATILLPRKAFIILIALISLSAGVNGIYGQVIGDTLDLPKTGWLFMEARQAGEAASEFTAPLILALAKLILAVTLLVATRIVIRPTIVSWRPGAIDSKANGTIATALLVAPSVLWPAFGFYPLAAERNLYHFTATILTAAPPPERAVVTAIPKSENTIKKIIWLVDESISYRGFLDVIASNIADLDFVDFGETAAMGHCSTPANVALRSGVNVRKIKPTTDLRKTPSIWGYALKAGYRTHMIDGQVSGPPQNLLLPPERALINKYENAAAGIETDIAMARTLNSALKTQDKQFVYALLRGVHFQYRDHYPEGALPANSSTQAQYEKAISYSKKDFFKTLLNGVDRSEVAIFYTSDHGQYIKDGVTPHCSGRPVTEEYAVPLIAFLPESEQSRFISNGQGGHSHSQLFPTTLNLMGFDPAYTAGNYDNSLPDPAARYIWFGRAIVPIEKGGTIDVQYSKRFPHR
ncbi:MAG: sulfatase-like hydrolase/transferase [Parasphingorhabdus sp.]|uniref:sulfatase-like hydrolase/transferase n=1 Tax=Parasphingorhabdus sp. TaxID=2709688 RepID=UPI003297D841